MGSVDLADVVQSAMSAYASANPYEPSERCACMGEDSPPARLRGRELNDRLAPSVGPGGSGILQPGKHVLNNLRHAEEPQEPPDKQFDQLPIRDLR